MLTVHLAMTAIVWVILIAVNVFVASEFPWAILPVVGSVGLVAHWYFGVAHVDTTVHQQQLDRERRAA